MTQKRVDCLKLDTKKIRGERVKRRELKREQEYETHMTTIQTTAVTVNDRTDMEGGCSKRRSRRAKE